LSKRPSIPEIDSDIKEIGGERERVTQREKRPYKVKSPYRGRGEKRRDGPDRGNWENRIIPILQVKLKCRSWGRQYAG